MCVALLPGAVAQLGYNRMFLQVVVVHPLVVNSMAVRDVMCFGTCTPVTRAGQPTVERKSVRGRIPLPVTASAGHGR